MRKLTLGSLFDGIGGFPLAASSVGITPVWASEIEPNYIAVPCAVRVFEGILAAVEKGKEMNANEVLKALVCCYKSRSSCKNCAFYQYSPICVTKLEKAAADLLKSQQARILELERAKNPIEQAEQWLDDMENPLEPIKLAAALNSEIFKLHYRLENCPEDISVLDYTVIACLKKELEASKTAEKEG